jgi:AcrR family transcriptional regulator
MGKKKNSYNNILNAAEAVVLKVGAAHMTLDSVAHKAGLSKGGLLYNFPTKELLLKAMVNRLNNYFKEIHTTKLAENKNDPAGIIKTHVLSILSRNRKTDRIMAALLAAAAYNPKLVEPVRKDSRKFISDSVTPTLGFTRVAVILFAALGLHLQEILQASCLNNKEREDFIAELLRLADELGESPGLAS